MGFKKGNVPWNKGKGLTDKKTLLERKLKRLEYKKGYYQKHPDRKINESKKSYINHREKRLKKAKEHYETNKEQIRIKVKEKLKTIKQKHMGKFGSKCHICGYNKCQSALVFHHIEPILAGNSCQRRGKQDAQNVSFDTSNTILVCQNCHLEIHAGLHPNYLKSKIPEKPSEEDIEEINKFLINLR